MGREEYAISDYGQYSKTGTKTKSKNVNNWATNQATTIANFPGNMTRFSDSVILDIGESTSSSSSSDKLNVIDDVEDDNDDEDDDEDDDAGQSSKNRVQHNDWEVRMLAAEMEKQERKRHLSLSDNLSGTKLAGTLLRRRRKFSDTETECSETDAEQAAHVSSRPRASSLDQFNLHYGIGRAGIFKAMSIDRDKDKL